MCFDLEERMFKENMTKENEDKIKVSLLLSAPVTQKENGEFLLVKKILPVEVRSLKGVPSQYNGTTGCTYNIEDQLFAETLLKNLRDGKYAFTRECLTDMLETVRKELIGKEYISYDEFCRFNIQVNPQKVFLWNRDNARWCWVIKCDSVNSEEKIYLIKQEYPDSREKTIKDLKQPDIDSIKRQNYMLLNDPIIIR